jgi:ComF family protein
MCLKDNELVICVKMQASVASITNFHFDNPEAVKKGTITVVFNWMNATALLHFSKKGIVQQLLHNLKYRGHEAIGHFFGEWLGTELSEIDTYKAVDVVIPVPLHPSKLRKRGFNQVTKFGKAIAEALGAQFTEHILIKTKNTRTQVFKERLRRWSDQGAQFQITDGQSLTGKHILLVDDIITTGSTIESCAEVLYAIDDIQLSIATIAIAD